jgi:hypothetical protein
VIGLTGGMRVMVATRPVDFCKGAEGLAALVREEMKSDPFSGAVYVFRAKRAERELKAKNNLASHRAPPRAIGVPAFAWRPYPSPNLWCKWNVLLNDEDAEAPNNTLESRIKKAAIESK